VCDMYATQDDIGTTWRSRRVLSTLERNLYNGRWEFHTVGSIQCTPLIKGLKFSGKVKSNGNHTKYFRFFLLKIRNSINFIKNIFFLENSKLWKIWKIGKYIFEKS